MKSFIKNRVRNLLSEQMIDGQQMNQHMQSLCNTMTVNSYDEVLGRIITAIGPKEKSPELWAKIEETLNKLKSASYDINKEKHTNQFGNRTMDDENMTGDSIPDEADTYWATIQSTLCEQGPDFQ